MKCSFSYEVILYDGKKYFSESGVSFADNFGEAAAILQDFYDSDLVAIQHLELFDETPVIILPRAVVKEIEASEDTNFAVPCDAHGNLI